MLSMQEELQAVPEEVRWVLCFSRIVVTRISACFAKKKKNFLIFLFSYYFFLPECHFPLFLSEQGFCRGCFCLTFSIFTPTLQYKTDFSIYKIQAGVQPHPLRKSPLYPKVLSDPKQSPGNKRKRGEISKYYSQAPGIC